MTIEEIKKSGLNNINIDNSLNAPLLKINIKLNSINTLSPSNLNIYVDKTLDTTDDLKTYTFNLINPLRYFNSVSDEFILEPVLDGTKIKMEAYIIRRVGDNVLLEEEVKELIEYQPIVLFEGNNYIYTNYEDATIDIVYPKNIELVKYFLNNSLFNEFKGSNLTIDDIYFKDVFTKVGSNINIEANNLNVNCITSKNNKFSLDSDGNLIVNSITTNNNPSANLDFDSIYPVGSVYLSVNSSNPSSYFGGVWEQISGYYLYAGTTGGVGGSNTTSASSGYTGATTLTVSQIPSHNHSIPSLSGTSSSAGAHTHDIGADFDGAAASNRYTVHSKGITGATHLKATSTAGAHTHNVATNASVSGLNGGNTGHTHSLNSHTHIFTPPYFNVFVFKRTA